ncbi:MAG: D-alanyl-D-alanine carboxypeptidase [Holosporales bacterium]|nr:D-alanyl-D-alanine carboxypeptidase [Holosporales bacterium]
MPRGSALSVIMPEAPKQPTKKSKSGNVVKVLVPDKATVVMDETGRTLFATNAWKKIYPASLTKLATLYLLFQALRNKRVTFRTMFRVSQNAAQQVPSKLGLAPGSMISVRHCILALAVKSANDIAVVVAEGLAGSVQAFCKQMNELPKRLGMTGTVFKNPSGLFDTGHVSTAADIAKLGLALRRDFPEYWHFMSLREFSHEGTKYQTHCRILSLCDAADGAKTGFVARSGYNLFVTAKDVITGRFICSVVIGEHSAISRDMLAMRLIGRYLYTGPKTPLFELIRKDLSTRIKTKPGMGVPPKSSPRKSKQSSPTTPALPVVTQADEAIQIGGATGAKIDEAPISRRVIEERSWSINPSEGN